MPLFQKHLPFFRLELGPIFEKKVPLILNKVLSPTVFILIESQLSLESRISLFNWRCNVGITTTIRLINNNIQTRTYEVLL